MPAIVQSLEALVVARRRFETDEEFFKSLEALEKAIRKGRLQRIGNQCLIGRGMFNNDRVIQALESSAERFVGVLVTGDVQAISPNSIVRYSGLHNTIVNGAAAVENSVLNKVLVERDAVIRDSYVANLQLWGGLLIGSEVIGPR